MKSLSIDEIKQIEFGILKQFKQFCQEKGIRYYLSNGTLLGAVKYKGFIPWDDDIDVFVPREDYLRLIREYPSDGNLKLLHSERDENYVFPFAKLSDPSTVIRGQTRLKKYVYGVHIDIFPLDFWGDDLTVAKRHAAAIHGSAMKLTLAIAEFSKGRTLVRTCAKTLLIAGARLIGWRHYKKQLDRCIQDTLTLKGNGYAGCVAWPMYKEREVLSSDAFANTVYLQFEGEEFPAPAGYDAYLSSLYGDWRKDPPVEKQKSHHRFRAYRV